jgi:hypothetical protein
MKKSIGAGTTGKATPNPRPHDARAAGRGVAAAAPVTARAGGRQWGIAIWGLSYHVDRSADYDEHNWGLGLRYTDMSVIKFGPVPGVAIGCGRVKTNVMAVRRQSSEPLAALTASLTIVF